MQTITDLKELIADLPAYLKVVVILAGLGTILGFAWISNPDEVETPAPSVNKEINLDTKSEVKQGNNEQNFNISQ
jgi:hypothetical protein